MESSEKDLTEALEKLKLADLLEKSENGGVEDSTGSTKVGDTANLISSSSGEEPAKRKEFVELNAKVEVATAQPSTPLLAASEWTDLKLSEMLMKGIYAKGFHRPSKIQEAALPLLLNSQTSMIAQAHNGSGKTATFSLTLLSKINEADPSPQGICICPTRELAAQNAAVITELGKYTKIKVFLAVAQCARFNANDGAQVIVGTPGKITDFLKKRLIPTKGVKMFILDEADEMIDRRNNMAPQVQQIRGFFPDKQLQILLFSATFTDEIESFAIQLAPGANKIRVRKENLTLSCITQYYKVCADKEEKKKQLALLYSSLTVGQSVIFVNSRAIATELTTWMKSEGHAVTLICGGQPNQANSMSFEDRDHVMDQFRSGATKVLITTDLLNRGIDVPQVTLVVNFDLPLNRDHNSRHRVNMESYIHRVGRTGRFGLKGVAIGLVTQSEIESIKEIEKFYDCEIAVLPEDIEEVDSIVRSLRN